MRGGYSKNLRHISRCEKCGGKNVKVFEGVNY